MWPVLKRETQGQGVCDKEVPQEAEELLEKQHNLLLSHGAALGGSA